MTIAQTQSTHGVATVTNGTTVPDQSTSGPMAVTSPGANQLMVVGVRTDNSAAPATACYSDQGSAGSPDLMQVGSPLINSPSTDYITFFWKVANGLESTIQASFTNSLQGTTTSQSVIGYLGFNGFLGTPTIDVVTTGTTGSAAAVVTTGNIVAATAAEVFVAFASLSNNYTSTLFFGVGTNTGTPVLTAGTTQLLAGYYVSTAIVSGHTSSFSWSTARNAGMIEASFYDQQWTPPRRNPSMAVRQAATYFSRVPWKEKGRLLVPGFADKRLVVAGA